MPADPNRAQRLDRLAQRLAQAGAVTPDIVFAVAADVCTRLPALAKAGKAGHIDRLIAAGAWSDAALALIEIELPAWKLRRLVQEDGEWFCSLSRELNLPLAIDDTADAQHEILPLAILCAFVEARRRTGAAREPQSRAAPRHFPAFAEPLCCDNFA